MSKMKATLEAAAAQANRKSCGCGGHGKHGQAEAFTVSAPGHPGQFKRSKDAGHSTHTGCCCGTKAASHLNARQGYVTER